MTRDSTQARERLAGVRRELDTDTIDDDLALPLLRVCTEAPSNVCRHPDAQIMLALLSLDEAAIRLTRPCEKDRMNPGKNEGFALFPSDRMRANADPTGRPLDEASRFQFASGHGLGRVTQQQGEGICLH